MSADNSACMAFLMTSSCPLGDDDGDEDGEAKPRQVTEVTS